MPQRDEGETIEPSVSVPIAKPTKPAEVAEAKAALATGLSPADLTWVLFNSREFMFVQ